MGTIDLGLMAAFAAVAESGSFSAAADRLRMPKSTVSRSVARLEAALGQQLLYRTTRKVTLTSAGTSLYQQAAPHLRGLDAAVATLAERPEQPTGVLRVTAANDLGLAFLADVAAGFCARHPMLRLEVALTVRRVDLVGEGFDVAIRPAMALEDSSLVARKLMAYEGQLFAAPSYLERRGRPQTFADLAAHDVVQFQNFGRPFRPPAKRGPSLLDLPHRIVADDFSFVRAALRAGAGIGLLPTLLVHDDLAAGTLVRVLPRFTTMRGAFYILYPAARHVPRKVTAFRDFVVDWVRERGLGVRR
jgi:DNA-binding transcriptional LysR family regulator